MKVDFYSDWETLGKSGTQCFTFLPVRFNNISPFIEKWYTIGIEPSPRSIPFALLEERRRQLRPEILQRVIFMCFKDIILASYKRFVLNKVDYLPRIGIFVAENPEERSVMALERLDYDMNYSMKSPFPYAQCANRTSTALPAQYVLVRR